MHGKVSTATWSHFIKVFKRECDVELLVSYVIHLFFSFCRKLEASLARWAALGAKIDLSLFGVFFFVLNVSGISLQKGESVKKMREEVGWFSCFNVQIRVLKRAVTHLSQRWPRLIRYFLFPVSAEWRSHQHLRGELSREDHNPRRADHLHFQGLLHDNWETRGGQISCCWIIEAVKV